MRDFHNKQIKIITPISFCNTVRFLSDYYLQSGRNSCSICYILAKLYINKKGQLSLTSPRDACETFARRFM